MTIEMLREYVGYVASLIVLVSLLMSSIKKLRWINLIGALLFGFYGFWIGSIPTGIMNLGIVIIDVYYLIRMYHTKEYFRVLQVDYKSDYLPEFINFYEKDIKEFVSIGIEEIKEAALKVFILRNMTPAGIFVADEFDEKSLEIKMDYVIPMYRDFKVGHFVFNSLREQLKKDGYTRFVSPKTENKDHINYLHKMGFVEENDHYVKSI